MKVDRKTKAAKSPPTARAVKSVRRPASKTNGKHPSMDSYEHLPVGVVECSLDARYVNVNEEFCRITGYERQELLQLGIKDITHEDDRMFDINLHERLVAGKIPFYKIEKRIKRKDGSDVWVELTRSAVRGPRGKLLYTIGAVLDISDRKQVERSLRESVERLRLATEAAKIFMWEWDLRTQTYTVDDNFEKVLGFSTRLLPKDTAEPVQRLIPPEDWQMLDEAVAKAIESHEDLHSLQTRFVNPENGEIAWLGINAKIVYDEAGNLQRMIGVAQNITENKQGEVELQLARRQAEQSADRTARLQRVTAALSEPLSPLQVAEVVTQQGASAWGAVSSSVMLLSEDGQTLEIIYSTSPKSHIRSYNRFPVSLQVPAADAVRSGELVWLESRQHYLERYPHLTEQINEWGQQAAIAIPLAYKERTLGVLTLSFDRILPHTAEDEEYILTLARQCAQAFERAHAEDALRESEERFRALVSQATAGIAQSDMDSRLVFVNPRLCEMLGYSEKELLGKTIWELTHTDDLEENQLFFQRMLNTGEPYQLEKRFVRRDGSTWWSDVSVTTIHDSSGRPKGGVGVMIDIEERKRAEQALTEFARQQGALYKLSEQLHRTDSLEDVYKAALDAILSALQCDRASILLYDHTNVMRFVAWRGLSDAYRKATDGHSPWSPDVKDPQPISLDDVRTADLDETLRAIIQAEGIGALAFIPLVVDEKLIGKFMIYYNEPHTFDEVELGLGLTIAHQLGLGVDRKRAEQDLRESEERYRFIVENTSDGIWWIELTEPMPVSLPEDEQVEWYYRHAVIRQCNLGLARMYGYNSVEEVMGLPLRVLMPHENPLNIDMLRQFIRSGYRLVDTETRERSRDGRELIFLNNMIGIVEDGMLKGEWGTNRDITERKRAEEALRESEERYRGIVNQTLAGIAETDLTGKFIMVNDRYCEITGYSRPELMNEKMQMQDVTHPDDLPKNMEQFARLAADGASFEIEKRYVRPDGSSIWVHNSVSAIIGPDGKPHTAVAAVIDVTERIRAEETLRRNEELFSTLVESAPFGVYFIDSEFRLRAINKGSEAVFRGIYPLIGRDFAEILHIVWQEPFATEAIERFRHTLQTGESFISPPTIEPRANIDEIQSYDWQIHRITMPDGTYGVVCYFYDLSEQKRMEARVRVSESLYRGIARSIPGGGVYVVDKDFRYLVAEGPVTEAFGLTREMLEGRTVTEAFPDERGARMEERLRRTFAGEIVSFETSFEGRVYWTQQAQLHETLGQAIILTLDITERKQAEEALRESEERFRAILRQATAGIVRKDAEGRLTFVNEAFCTMLGRTEAELLGKTMWDFMHEDDVAENKRSFQRLMLEGIPFKLERRLLRADGSVIWVDASVSPIMDATGKPQSAVTVEVDITGRKQAEEALQQLNLQLEERVLSRTSKLRAVNQAMREEITERQRVEEALRQSEAAARENEEKLSTLFELLPVGISFLNSEGQIIQMNSALTNILKLSKEKFSDRAYKDRTYIRANGTLMPIHEFASHRAFAEGKTVYNVETGIVMENGEVIWTSVSAAPVAVADVGAVVVTADITESKRAERALQESRERLQTLSQRLVEVQEDERRAIARELHDRVGQTLAALNINLIIISGQLGGKVDGQISTRLNDSMKLVAETISLVRDVMSDLRPSVLDDYGLEAALESYFSQFMSRYQIGIKFEKPEQSIPRLGPSIEMTFLRIAQEALMNIVKHAQASQVILSLHRDVNTVCLTVRDNGLGIVSWQEANRPGSHGLTIMRERAEAFGGNLKISSVPGKGTTVEVKIPVETNDPSPTEKENSQ